MPVYESCEADPLSKVEQVRALRDARALLGPDTWRQDGSYGFEVLERPSGAMCVVRDESDEGCYCLVGAVAKVLGLNPDSVEVQSVVHPLTIAFGGGPLDESELTVWNDAEATTLRDVHELLDRTVVLLEGPA